MSILSQGVHGHLMFDCPGCDVPHVINVTDEGKPIWTYNGDPNKPTFMPSILVRFNWGPEQKKVVCHSFVKDGMIQFLTDCTHALKGQTVPLLEWS